jgi:hypothetical protein
MPFVDERVIDPSPTSTKQFRNISITYDKNEIKTMSLTFHLALSKSGTQVEAPEVGRQNAIFSFSLLEMI